MSRAIAVFHGVFGRAAIYRHDLSLATHAHREGHLIFLISGSDAQVRLGACAQPISESLAVAVDPWQQHSFEVPGPPHRSVTLLLYVRPEWFLEMSRSLSLSGLRFGRNVVDLTPAIAGQVKRIAAMLLDGGGNEPIDGRLFELTRDCYNQTWQARPGQAECLPVGNFARDRRIRRALQCMKDSLSEGDGVLFASIARESGLSRPHFFKLFRDNLGVTPNVYLNTLRMERAIEEITRSDAPITSIGLGLGFSSQASFTRFFASNVGIPPTDYRRVAHIAA